MNVIAEVLQFNAQMRGFLYTAEELEIAEQEALMEGVSLFDVNEIAQFVNRKIMERAH